MDRGHLVAIQCLMSNVTHWTLDDGRGRRPTSIVHENCDGRMDDGRWRTNRSWVDTALSDEFPGCHCGLKSARKITRRVSWRRTYLGGPPAQMM